MMMMPAINPTTMPFEAIQAMWLFVILTRISFGQLEEALAISSQTIHSKGKPLKSR